MRNLRTPAASANAMKTGPNTPCTGNGCNVVFSDFIVYPRHFHDEWRMITLVLRQRQTAIPISVAKLGRREEPQCQPSESWLNSIVFQ